LDAFDGLVDAAGMRKAQGVGDAGCGMSESNAGQVCGYGPGDMIGASARRPLGSVDSEMPGSGIDDFGQ